MKELYHCEVQLSKHMKIATADRMLYCDRRAVLEDVILLFIGEVIFGPAED